MKDSDIELFKYQIRTKIPYVLFEEIEEVLLTIRRIAETIFEKKIIVIVDVSGNEIEAYAGYDIFYLKDNNDTNFIDTVNIPVVWSQNPKEN